MAVFTIVNYVARGIIYGHNNVRKTGIIYVPSHDLIYARKGLIYARKGLIYARKGLIYARKGLIYAGKGSIYARKGMIYEPKGMLQIEAPYNSKSHL